MHILHFMNIPFEIDQFLSGGDRINHSGGWMVSLIRQMLIATNHRLTCVSFGKTNTFQVSKADRIHSVVIPEKKGLAACSELVSDMKPDVIHIHGTESAFGLLSARGVVQYPVLISLQGLLGPCSQWHNFFGDHYVREILRMHRWEELPTMRGLWKGYFDIKRKAKRETEIISKNKCFMGRTEWDRAYIRSINPSAYYHHGGEILRNEFWQDQWSINGIKRHSIIFTNAAHPRKGTLILLDAFMLLKPLYPDIQIGIAGDISKRSGYGRYLRERIRECGGGIIELGQLNASEMTKEMLSSHVFISPSYIDNSPNAVCEAQLMGMPVIASYTGGVPSLIEENRTGLFFPKGDAPMLAQKIRQVFEDDNLAVRLGQCAREIATERHDPGIIVKEILHAYEKTKEYGCIGK